MSELQESAIAKNYVLFSLAGHFLAIDCDALVEVLEPLPVSALPLVPNYVDGLVNLNGEIIPQINLQMFLHSVFDEPCLADESYNATLLVVRVAGQLMALKVGMIQESLQLLPEQLQNSSSKDCYLACFYYQQTQVHILSSDCLQGMVQASDQPRGKRSFLGDVGEELQGRQVSQEYLYVACAEQKYAILLSDIYEVVDVVEIKRQPDSPEAVIGVAVIRNTATLVFSLQALVLQRLGMDAKSLLTQRYDANEHSLYSLLLVRRDNLYCGLLVDEVIGLQLIDEQYLHSGEHNWQQLIISDKGEVAAQLIVLDDFFDETLCQKYKAFMPSLSSVYQVDKIPQQELLTFAVKGDRFALCLSDVVRIINDRDVQPLLEKQSTLTGAIEFDGSAIPVVDLGLQLADEAINDKQEFIIVTHNHEKWAFAIDAIEEIVSVDKPSIEVLSMADKNINRSVKAYVCCKEELLSILDVDVICRSNIIRLEVS